MSHFNIDGRTCFLAVSGSHAYGMATPASDLDLRGVCVPPMEIRESYHRSFEQWQTTSQVGPWGPKSEEALGSLSGSALYSYQAQGKTVDVTVFGMTKFVRLAAASNPNVLELLFVEDNDVLLSTPAWELLREHRGMFLSKKCRATYVGYAQSQLKRIRSHRAWLLNPPARKPTRADFGLPETSVISKNVRDTIAQSALNVVAGWSTEEAFDGVLEGPARVMVQERLVSFQEAFLASKGSEYLDVQDLAEASLGLAKGPREILSAERRYREALKQWAQYECWKRERNPTRAALEAKYGFDTKHGSHVVRLLRSGLEVLRDGALRVRRPDAEELLAIRRGAMTYEELIELADKTMAAVQEAAESSALPKKPDASSIDELLFRALRAG